MHKNIHTGHAGIMRAVTKMTLTGTSTYLAAAFTLKKKKKKYLLNIFGLIGAKRDPKRENTHRERQDGGEECSLVIS